MSRSVDDRWPPIAGANVCPWARPRVCSQQDRRACPRADGSARAGVTGREGERSTKVGEGQGEGEGARVKAQASEQGTQRASERVRESARKTRDRTSGRAGGRAGERTVCQQYPSQSLQTRNAPTRNTAETDSAATATCRGCSPPDTPGCTNASTATPAVASIRAPQPPAARPMPIDISE